MESSSTTAGPGLVRAKWTRTAMDCVPDDVAAKVLDSLSDEMKASISSAPLLGWIPVSTHVALCQGWHAELGDEGFRTLFRETFLSAVNAPLLGSIVKGSLRVFGSTPSAATRAWKVGWPYIFRHGGRVEILEAGATSAAIKVLDLPPELRDESFALGVAGSFDGNAELVGKSGVAQYDTARLAHGTMHLALEWS